MNRLDFIDKNLQRQLEFQKYAEAKNATLIVAALAALTIVFQVTWPKFDWISDGVLIGISSILLLLSASISALSFIPQGRRTKLETSVPPNTSILYFEEIAGRSISNYTESLTENPNWNDEFSIIELDYVEQIISNANIVSRKMKFFNWGARLFVCGLLAPFVLVTVSYTGTCF